MYKTLHLCNIIYHHLPLSTLISVHLPYSPLIYRHSPSTIFISLFLSSFTFIFYHPWKTFQESAVFDSYHLKRQKSPFWPSKFQQFLGSMLSIYPSKDFIYLANINPIPLTNPRFLSFRFCSTFPGTLCDLSNSTINAGIPNRLPKEHCSLFEKNNEGRHPSSGEQNGIGEM